MDVAPLVTTLADRGYAVMPDFLNPDQIRDLSADFDRCRRDGEFRKASVGKGEDRRLAETVRRDEIRWFDPAALSPAQSALWSLWETLRVRLNESLMLGLWSLEAHFACYSPGAFYARHVDRFHADTSRVLSLILYLNEGWRAVDGGQLRLYGQSAVPELEVNPEAGTLVCFLSEQTPHEVLPTSRERRSVAGWFRRREQNVIEGGR